MKTKTAFARLIRQHLDQRHGDGQITRTPSIDEILACGCVETAEVANLTHKPRRSRNWRSLVN